MRFATWAYPWDILDEGVETVADRLRDLGIGEINLATNYHTLQGFLPHNPERRTFFAHASAFFQPQYEYEELRPIPNEQMGEECWLTEIADGLPDDIGLNSWTIGCHNSRIGMRNPEYTLTNAHGDSLVFGLCPSNPHVQQYLVDIIEDLDGRDVFDRIELESFDYFHGSGFGWHHDKFHTQLGELGEFLFGVCFCEHCTSRAEDAGIDVESARIACRETVDALAEGQLSKNIDPLAWLQAYPEVEAYLTVRENTLTDLFAEVRAATDADLGYYPLLPPDQAWMHGADIHELANHLDYVKVIAYESNAEDARESMETGNLLTPDIPIHAGILPGHPHIHDAATARNVVDAVIDAGAERVSFYNYGLLPDRNLEWIGDAIAPYA